MHILFFLYLESPGFEKWFCGNADVGKQIVDRILFGNFEVTVTQGNRNVTSDTSKKGKAADLSHRIIYTNSDNPTFDAKNRLGLPAEIEMGESAREGWGNLAKAIVESRKVSAVATAPTTEQKPEERNA